MASKIKIYSKTRCRYCDLAKKLLSDKGLAFEEILMDNRHEEYAELREKTGWMTVPQIFINDKFIGGYDDLVKLEQSKTLEKLLAE